MEALEADQGLKHNQNDAPNSPEPLTVIRGPR